MCAANKYYCVFVCVCEPNIKIIFVSVCGPNIKIIFVSGCGPNIKIIFVSVCAPNIKLFFLGGGNVCAVSEISYTECFKIYNLALCFL